MEGEKEETRWWLRKWEGKTNIIWKRHNGVFRVTLTAELLGVLTILYLHRPHASSPGTICLWYCQESTRFKPDAAAATKRRWQAAWFQIAFVRSFWIERDRPCRQNNSHRKQERKDVRRCSFQSHLGTLYWLVQRWAKVIFKVLALKGVRSKH